MVAPLVGAWIEIQGIQNMRAKEAGVAPLVGAWIEIISLGMIATPFAVAPLVGAWIEIIWDLLKWSGEPGRSSRGSVD